MTDQKLTPRAAIAISTLGRNINIARRKRRLSQRDLAAMMGVSVSTVRRLEGGDPGISLGVLAMAFIALGNIRRFSEVLDVATDDIGLLADQEKLPHRIRKRKHPVDITCNDHQPIEQKSAGWHPTDGLGL